MAGPFVFARVVSLERTLLLTLAFEDGCIQVQRVTLGALRQTLYLPLGQRFEPSLHLAHAEAAKQIADGIVGWEPLQAQQRLQSSIAAQ